jgi:hypothetical protein
MDELSSLVDEKFRIVHKAENSRGEFNAQIATLVRQDAAPRHGANDVQEL